MLLYHGSTIIVQVPVILDSQRLLDFGKGFYTTTSIEQAQKWAFIKQKRDAGNTNPIVNIYEFDENLLTNSNFSVKLFNQVNEEWLDFVFTNRTNNTPHIFDIVKGAVANDTLYRTLSLYESGILTKPETIVRLKTHLMFGQISFHNNKVLEHLIFKGSSDLGESK